MTTHDVRLWVSFGALYAQNAILAGVQDGMVSAHVAHTSRLAVPNIAGDMLRETLELGIRRMEFKRHTIKQRYIDIGEEIINGQDNENHG